MRLLLLATMLVMAPLPPDEWWKVPEAKAYGDYFKAFDALAEPSRYQIQQRTWFNHGAGRNDLNILSSTNYIEDKISNCSVAEAQLFEGDSLEYVLGQAENNGILMFNESHSILRQRYFLFQNLKRFWDAGYRYIGFEALAHNVNSINEFDTSEELYLREPLLAATARKALAIGFKVFDYEARADQYDMKAAFNERMLGREQAQARNINSYISTIPEGDKVLIWAGYKHISKKWSDEKEGWMAAQLEHRHGIRSYTVDLVGCAYYAEVISGQPMMYISGGDPIEPMGQSEKYIVDAQLHLPEVLNPEPGLFRSVLGTPIYLASEDRQLSDTLFVQAYKPGQPSQAVPYDAVFMFEGENLPVYLPTGEFELRLYGSDGGLLKTIHHILD